MFPRLRHWLGQATTLSGLAALIGGAFGIWSGALPQDLGATLMAGALPLLLPDNSTARHIGQAALPVVEAALARHGLSKSLTAGLPDGKKAVIFNKNEKETIMSGADIVNNSTPTAADIEGKLEEIASALGANHLPEKYQGFLHLFGMIGVTAANALLPLAADKIDVPAFQGGLGKAADGLLGLITGLEEVEAATRHKTPAPISGGSSASGSTTGGTTILPGVA